MHSLRTMSVVAKQKTVEQLYEYQAVRQAGFAVFDTVTTSIHQRLSIFRNHHQTCLIRRKNALAWELRQENQRTEWLKRKYMDSVRQQQQQTTSARLDSSNPRGFELTDHGQHANEQKNGLAGDVSEQSSSKHCSNGQVKVVDSPPPSSKTGEDNAGKAALLLDNVLIKREPEPEDPLPPSQVSREARTYSKSECGHGLEIKRRLSQTVKTDSSKWSEDTRDELKLTAYDVIAGVINTHPIQPLEQDTDCTRINISSSSPCSSMKGRDITVQANRPITSTASSSATTTSSCSSPAPPSILTKKKEQHSLVKDLDEFSKVMHQVAQEQKAKERRVSIGTELETVYPSPSNNGPQLHGPPPYLGIGHSRPNENNNYYRQKYIQLQAAPPNRSQVDSANNAVKSQLILPGLTDPPVSHGNHHPPTPTTPLEHFSSFQSPHAANGSPVLHSPQACPPPYSSTATAMCYPYDAVPTSSSVGEQWPHLSPHTQQAIQHNVTDMQENLKDTILARVSSCVVALAGQKRPSREFNNSVLPPTKLAILGHPPPPPHSNTSAPLRRYPDCTISPYPCAGASPYPGARASPFPH